MTLKTPKWYFYMEQELNSISKVAIVGAGPAGCLCAYFLQESCDVTLYDYASPLRTLLCTGGGRCNLGYAEYDFLELVKNYPRGEKFLYSVFSKFSTFDTINFFENIGVNTYVQDDKRIFPVENSAKFVRQKMLRALNKVKFKKQMIENINPKEYDFVVIAIGGHSSYSLLKRLGHNIIPPKPSLVGLRTAEKFPAGVCLKNIWYKNICDDLLFTHEGISGPLVYKISSINARCEMPYLLSFNLLKNVNIQDMLNSNPHKNIKNLLCEFVPKSLSAQILNELNIDTNLKCHNVDSATRNSIIEKLNNFKITVTGVSKKGEVVTAGGVDLKEVDSKTMRSKIVPNIYFCGEVLDIDGFCGGFNLQNCWSTAYVAAQGILKSISC